MNSIQPEIIGEKVVLRPINQDDTQLIVQWRNNPSVRRNFVFQTEFTEEMHRKWLETKVKTGNVVQYIIEEKSSRTPVGSVYFRDIDTENHSAEYGIFIGEDSARGKGFGSETAKLFTAYGLKMLHFHRISLRVFADNHQAYASYVKAGFCQEGLARDMVNQNGEYRDMIFMAIIAERDAL